MTKLKVEGMTCGHCEAAVKEVLEDFGGLTEIEVSHKENYAQFTGEVNINEVIAAIVEEGYQATNI